MVAVVVEAVAFFVVVAGYLCVSTTAAIDVPVCHCYLRTAFALSETVRQEGVRALWRGIGPILVGVIPARAVYFATYSKSKPLLAEWMGGEKPIVHLASAAVAGLTANTLTNPIWVVKTRMQVSECCCWTLGT